MNKNDILVTKPLSLKSCMRLGDMLKVFPVKLNLDLKTKLFIVAIFIVHNIYAQYNPYNPGYALGQQIGNAIQHSSKYGRNQLRKSIKKWGECKNASLSLGYGAVAIYGSNGYFCSATVDSRISSKLKSINKSGGNVIDINITENGNFIIIYNKGKEWYGVLPATLKKALDDFPYGTEFKSISFNESGTYAITTSKGFFSNNSVYQAFYDDNVNDFGELLSVNISGNGAVFCYSDKTRYCGRIPVEVESAIKKFSNTANFVKFNKHGDYIICSKYGSYSYSIGDADAGNNASTVYYDYNKERKVIAKQRAYEKWHDTANYRYSDKTKIHTVSCKLLNVKDVEHMCIETCIQSGNNFAPTINFIFPFAYLTKFGNMLDDIPDSGLGNISLKIELANGEILKSNAMIMSKCGIGSLGLGLSVSLVSIRSNKRSLSGSVLSTKYLIDQLSFNNIKTITFKEENVVNLSGIETKSQFCYDFHRLADEAGRMDILN